MSTFHLSEALNKVRAKLISDELASANIVRCAHSLAKHDVLEGVRQIAVYLHPAHKDQKQKQMWAMCCDKYQCICNIQHLTM